MILKRLLCVTRACLRMIHDSLMRAQIQIPRDVTWYSTVLLFPDEDNVVDEFLNCFLRPTGIDS